MTAPALDPRPAFLRGSGAAAADPIAGFRSAIIAADLEPPDRIIPDGALHRFSTNGRRGDDAGWYVLHLDGVPAGAFGCWRLGIDEKWCARSERELCPAERAEFRRRMDEAREARRRAEEKARAECRQPGRGAAEACGGGEAGSPLPCRQATLVEYGAGVPRAWAEGFARLDRSAPPPGFTPRQWEQVVNGGGLFLDRWAAEAIRLGWTAEDVFGVHPAAPGARYDRMGLVPLIGGGAVVCITTDRATIRQASGATSVYLRRPRPGAIALWKLGTPTDRSRFYGGRGRQSNGLQHHSAPRSA
jgi:hypothetical protein